MVTYIGAWAFLNCTSLEYFTFPNSVKILYERTFEGCTSLKRVSLNSIINIGEYSFINCTSLTSVKIPNSVVKLGIYSFSNCTSLKKIIIGNNVNEIGKNAFAGCYNLEEVYCYPEIVPSTHGQAFQNSYTEYATLYVPEPSLANYKAKAPWSHFGTILPIEETGTSITLVPSENVLINSKDGLIHVSGIGDGQQVAIYQTDGKLVATAKAYNGSASVATNISKGTAFIVKIGEKAVKVMMK